MTDRNLCADFDATIAIFSESLVGVAAAGALGAIGATVVPLSVEDWKEVYAADGADWDCVVFDRIGAPFDPEYPADVARLNRRAWVTATTFGLDGPMSAWVGGDLVCAAAGGLVAALRSPNGRPAIVPGHQALIDIGHAASLATMDGINRVRSTGDPVHLDLSGQEAVAFSTVQQECAHVIYECAGAGGVTRYCAPSGLFPCMDGMVRIIVIDDHQWLRFAEAVGKPDWAEKYRRIESRRHFADEITALVAEWARHRSKYDCEELLQAHGIAATAVRSFDEVTRSHQFTYRRFGACGAALPAIVRRPAAASRPTTGGRRTLDDLNVLEISNVLAVPLAASLLGVLGANVVRLEDLDRLDVYRRNGPFARGEADVEKAAYFLGANYAKRSLAGRFLTGDRDLLTKSVEWADVVLENVGPGRLDRLGVSDQLAHRSADGKLLVSVSGLGQSGPHGHYKGYAGNFHAYAGLDDLVSQSCGTASTLKTALADYDTAVWVALLIAAWGMGRRTRAAIDVSMGEVVALRVMKGALVEETGGEVRDLDESAAGAGGGGARYAVCERASWSEATDLGPDPVAQAQSEGLPAYYCRTPADLFADPQLSHRRFFVEAPHPVASGGRILALPWKVAGLARRPYASAPLLGEANEWMSSLAAVRSRESGMR